MWVNDLYTECDIVPSNSLPLILHCSELDQAITRHRLQRGGFQTVNFTV
jgi:hypothetical protein